MIAVVVAALVALGVVAFLRPTQTAAPSGVEAIGLPPPATAPLLSVTGAISVTNAEGRARFDLGLLDALPQTSFTTTTIWTSEPQEFAGVLLADFLEAIGAKGTTLRMTAVNDYVIEVPVADAVPGGPILATRINGEVMSLRDKGPIWLVYPFDRNADYQSEVIYARSIWQLDRIEVLP
jgi:hypothetical protein